jgi:hypothetical protein
MDSAAGDVAVHYDVFRCLICPLRSRSNSDCATIQTWKDMSVCMPHLFVSHSYVLHERTFPSSGVFGRGGDKPVCASCRYVHLQAHDRLEVGCPIWDLVIRPYSCTTNPPVLYHEVCSYYIGRHFRGYPWARGRSSKLLFRRMSHRGPLMSTEHFQY